MEYASSTTKIDKLESNKYHAWKQKIKHLLALKDLDEFIDCNVEPQSTAEWKRKDIKAQAIIGLTLSDEMLESVREVSSTKEMWQKICDIFEKHTLLNKLSARRKFIPLRKMKEKVYFILLTVYSNWPQH